MFFNCNYESNNGGTLTVSLILKQLFSPAQGRDLYRRHAAQRGGGQVEHGGHHGQPHPPCLDGYDERDRQGRGCG